MKIDREALRAAGGGLESLRCAQRMGYCIARIPAGDDVITSPDGEDWVFLPHYSMRQADEVIRLIARMPRRDLRHL